MIDWQLVIALVITGFIGAGIWEGIIRINDYIKDWIEED